MSERKQSVLICTPAYGGLVYYSYTGSLLDLYAQGRKAGIPVAVNFLYNESLIGRARNRLAWQFLQSPFDKLLFVDADIAFSWYHFRSLYESDKLLVGGTYPVKQLPIELNLNALPEHQDVFPHKVRSYEQLQELGEKYGNEAGEIPVRHIPTGFMMIDRAVFMGLRPHMKKYTTLDNQKNEVEMWDFFPSGVTDEGQYMSEDWQFCENVRKYLPEIGVWLNSNVVLPHTGTHTFKVEGT